MPAFAAKDFNVKNDTQSFLFVSGANGNVGIGTTTNAALFQVGVGTPSGTADLSSNSALIKGNLEVDGIIYGNGSQLTGVAGAVSGLTNYSVPRSLADGKTLIDSGIYLNASGNVGVGTTSPAYALDVMGTFKSVKAGVNIVPNVSFDLSVGGSGIYSTGAIYSSSRFQNSQATGDGYLQFVANAGPILLRNQPDNYPALVITQQNAAATGDLLQLKNNNATAFLVSVLGNVGVGSTTPRAKLEVVGSGSTTGTAFQIDDNLYNPKVTVLDNGKVGIGTTAPAVALDVVGVIKASTAIQSGNYVFGAGIGMYNTNNTRGFYGFDSLTPLGAFPLVLSAGDAATYTDSYIKLVTTGLERMRIDKSGNVGIGTISPRAKLEIVASGSTTGTAFQIDDSLYNPKVTVLDNGNVGIGSTAPRQRLDVDASIYVGNNVMVGNALADSGNTPRVQITGTKVIINLQ
ncbi:MAG: hypothetical protein V2A70_08260 [Candidatus Omnitrophota bacterium]